MDQLLELLAQIQELADMGIEMLAGGAEGAAPEGEELPPEEGGEEFPPAE